MFHFLLFAATCYVLFRLLDFMWRFPTVSGMSSRHVFVTGCDSGFGRCLAKRLDKVGFNVFAGCLTENGKRDLASETSSKLEALLLDVTDHESVVRAFEVVQHELADSGLWALVNNAGIAGSTGPSAWLRKDDYQRVLDVNAFGLVDVTSVFLPLVLKSRGRIVNIASIMGRNSGSGCAPYAMSKYAVEAYTDTLRREVCHFGVSVSMLEPGYFRTGIICTDTLSKSLRRSFDNAPKYSQDVYGEAYLEQTSVAVKKMICVVSNEDITPVIDAYVHAITSRRPRARYVVGWDAKFFWLPVQWLPEWIGDWILNFFGQQNGVPRPARCSS